MDTMTSLIVVGPTLAIYTCSEYISARLAAD
jgi:hypothetical protein